MTHPPVTDPRGWLAGCGAARGGTGGTGCGATPGLAAAPGLAAVAGLAAATGRPHAGQGTAR